MAVPVSHLPAAAAGAAPSLQVFCSVAITPLRSAGARRLVGAVALQQVPHPGRVWQGGDGPLGDRVHPRLRPGPLPALSPPVVWGIGDCAVVVNGLKQFSVTFDFTEQMLSPLFQHNVRRWQGFALPAAQRSGARLGSPRSLSAAAWSLPLLHTGHRENHSKPTGKMPCQQPAAARAGALSGKDGTRGVLSAGCLSGNWASLLSPVDAQPLVCCPACPVGVAISSLCPAMHIGLLCAVAWGGQRGTHSRACCPHQALYPTPSSLPHARLTVPSRALCPMLGSLSHIGLSAPH